MYMTYGEAVNVDEMREKRYLPEGLVGGCRLIRAVKRDEVITYNDVVLPQGRLSDEFRREQYVHFFGSSPI
jgi:predicted homoserine dehydrogenase-like protein